MIHIFRLRPRLPKAPALGNLFKLIQMSNILSKPYNNLISSNKTETLKLFVGVTSAKEYTIHKYLPIFIGNYE